MSKSLKIYLLVFVAMVVVVVLIDSTRKRPVNWAKSYKLEDKIPLGLYVFNQEIDHLAGQEVLRYNLTPYEYFREKKGDKQTNETFLIINDYVYMDSLSVNAVMKRVRAGSSLFISSDGFPKSLLDTLNVESNYQYLAENLFKKDSLNLCLTNEKWKDSFFPLSPITGEYAFTNVDSKTTTALGYMIYPAGRRYLSFIRVKFGKGFVYLHNQPVVFTNFSLLAGNDLSDYTSYLLSYLPKGKPIVWLAKDQTFTNGETGKTGAKTVLGVIFRYPSLRLTWLIFLYGMLIYIFFNAKRRQRIIPVIKPLQNTTVEFTQTIVNLYFQEGDVGDVMGKKIIYFLDKIRNRYYLDTQKLDDSFIRKLQVKSGKDKELIRQIVDIIQKYNISKTAIEKELVRLNELIEKFWNACI